MKNVIMNDKKQNQKLAAILSADVKDYNRLLSEDEKMFVRTRTYYQEIMALSIQKHRGRLIEAPGNNLLAEFSSVEDALHCALKIQQEIHTMNGRLPKERRLNFRIGMDFGYAIEEEGRIYGECVNTATGLTGFSEEGAICISGSAYDQVKDRFSFRCNFQGKQTIENLKEPVRVYRIPIEQKAAAKVTGDKKGKPKQRKKVPQIINAVVIAAVVVLAIWNFYFRESTPPSKGVTSDQPTALPLSDKLSVAVLPFVNLNRNSRVEHLCNDMTTDIIVALAKFQKLTVIPRNMVFAYKGKPIRIKDLGRELGVRYMVEGSILKAGSNVRVYAQLMDTTTGRRLWSESYEPDLADLSAVPQQIVQTLGTEMKVKP
jgi:adenylate cyclase